MKFKRLVTIFAALVVIAPTSVSAQSMSVTQTITITATVAPMRSIVVNEQGRITKIYSNTAENVQPKVYVNNAPGPQKPLTDQLKSQYESIISKQSNLVGVEIPVEPPIASGNSVQKLLLGSISSLTRHFSPRS